ncbi:MAG: hypothetical protein GC179_22025 [Anaerolineaceae bacterium]|nr:hypothetical protein [Anaerolineaceae bacterium]
MAIRVWSPVVRLNPTFFGEELVNVDVIFGNVGNFRRDARLNLRQKVVGMSDAKIANRSLVVRSNEGKIGSRQASAMTIGDYVPILPSKF